MPFTLRRSSGFWNGASLRYSMIARAFAGPTPGSFASSSAPAELMLTRAPAAGGAAPAATAPRPVPASVSPQRSPTATALVIRCISTSFGAPAAPLAASLGVTMARAGTATTKEGAHLRQGPSASTALLGELPPRTTLDVLGTSGGWRQVRTPEGTVGYVWAEHLAEEARPSEAPRRTSEASSAAPRSVADELHDLRQAVSA